MEGEGNGRGVKDRRFCVPYRFQTDGVDAKTCIFMRKTKG